MHDLCIFDFFVQKSFLNKNHFQAAEINLTTRGPKSKVYQSPASVRN